MDSGVAIVTGANRGIGLSLVKKLLKETSLNICMVCRNKIKAHLKIRDLSYEFPSKKIDLVICDISNPRSVMQAAKEIRERYSNISHIFCNAGAMLNPIVDWRFMMKTVFTRNFVHMMSTAQGLLKQTDKVNEEGLCEIFSTNFFGHFILLMELEDILGIGSVGGRIWTSSSNARKSSFSLIDIQHKNRLEPYSSSKYAIDIISYQLNQEWNRKEIYSHTTCPGFVVTNFAYRILQPWIWYFIIPILLLCRILVPNLTLRPDIACYSLFWLSMNDPSILDPMTKFYTTSTFFGSPQVHQRPMVDLDPDTARKCWIKMNHMLLDYKTYGCVKD